MTFMKLTMLMVSAALLVGCNAKDNDAPSTDPVKPETNTSTEQDSGDNQPIDLPEFDSPTLDPPVFDPPANEPPADEPPADGSVAAAVRVIDVDPAEKLEVRHSMIGFRNTLLFYTDNDQQAVLTLLIDNADETFPVKGTVYLFDEATTAEAIDKWINNQHSDGLFPDVPEPISQTELPEEVCQVTSHEKIGTETSESPVNPGEYDDYEVKLSVKDYSNNENFQLTGFDDTAHVFIKSE